MGRCLSPCLGDLDPNLYRRRLDEALALFTGARRRRRRAARPTSTARCARPPRPSASSAPRGCGAAASASPSLLERLGGVLAASHARPRLVLAEHPRGGRFDAFWLVGGRVVDWGPLGDLDDVCARTAAALRGGDGTGATTSLAPDEVDEARIVATWLASHDAATLDLARAPGAPEIERFVARTRELSEARREMNAARRAAARATDTEADAGRGESGGGRGGRERGGGLGEGEVDDLCGPRTVVADRERVARAGLAAHERERDRRRAAGRPRRSPSLPDLAVAEAQRGAALDRLGQPQAAQVAVRLAAPVQPRDRLLADVAALREAHGAAR